MQKCRRQVQFSESKGALLAVKRSLAGHETVVTAMGFRVAKRAGDCFHLTMEPNDNTPGERINNYVAVTVAILAAFMAVTKVKDDNICQAMVKEKSDEVNTWSYYQSKSVKQNLAELGRAQLAGLAGTTTGDVRAQIEAQVARYDL